MNKSIFIILLAYFIGINIKAGNNINNNIKIEKAQLAGPFSATTPILIDSVNKKGKSFSSETYLKDVKPNDALLFKKGTKQTIKNGQALPNIANSDAISYLKFTLTCKEYFKGKLKINKIKHFKTYIDGNEATDKLVLEPTRHEIIISCLVKKEAKDTFDICIEGDSHKILINDEGKRPYTLYDVTDGLHYNNISLSPSGKYALIGYSKTYPTGKSKTFTQLIEVETNKVIVPNIDYYEWCQDKDALYGLRPNDKVQSLAIMDVPSFTETVLAENIPHLPGATLSPNLSYIIYSSDDKENARNADFMHYAMPDDHLSDSRNHTFLHIYDLNTGFSHPITYGKTSTYLRDISSDGNLILFATAKTELHRYPFDRSSLYCYYVDENRIDTIFTDTIGIERCKFSPDSKSILISGTADAFGGIGKVIPKETVPNTFDIQLFLYDLNLKTIKPLTKNLKPSVDNFVWLPRDGNIYLTAVNGSKKSFYMINPNTDEIHQYNYPLSYIQSFSISENSDIVMLHGQGPTYARKMITAKLSDKKEKTKEVGNIHFEEDFANVTIPEFHQWRFLSSRGDSIDGFYLLPPNFDKDKKYPMIVYYYGGCTPTNETLEKNYPFAVWANQGYVVYVVEPSGAIGYGQEFASRHVNTWGTGSSDDILEGTRTFCSTHPYINKDRLACIGASYGGFMTEYILTKTNMFRTAIAHAGISDLTGYWGAGNWGYTYNEIAAAKSFPWNNRELYVDHSPLYNADKIVTPLLLIQGSVDNNVPNKQAWQLYTALKILNKPVEFVEVKGENHVIRDYLKQKEWQKTICAWFAKWLKDEPLWWQEMYPQ